MATTSVKPTRSSDSKISRADLDNRAAPPTNTNLKPRIGGPPIDVSSQPDTYKIEAAKNTLNVSKGANKRIGLSESAFVVLNLLIEGSISPEKKHFSLLEVSTDMETIDNENILDTQSFKNKPESVSTADKFSTSDDPFYELDDDIPTDYEQSNEFAAKTNKPNVACFVADVAAGMLQLSTNTSSTSDSETTEAATTVTEETTITTMSPATVY
jgi:hypothetical protein